MLVLYNGLTATPSKEAVLLTNTWMVIVARGLRLRLIVVEEVTNWSINVEPLLSDSATISIPGTTPQGLKVMVTELMNLLTNTVAWQVILVHLASRVQLVR